MYKSLVKGLGKFGIKHFSEYLNPLKDEIVSSNLSILFEVYVGKMLAITFLSFVGIFSGLFVVFMIMQIPLLFSLVTALIASVASSFGILTIYHSYPFHLITSKKGSIEANMPFAINHMAAIAASGVPPFIVFKLLARIPEYGEMANESRRVVRNVDTFGMDIISGVKNVAKRTPSPELQQFLYGIVSTIDTGGDLKLYLENSAKDALFNYRLRREKYMQTLSTYADFYTAVLIAAPLFFVSVLSIMSLVGGQIFGLSIPDAMRAGIFGLIPLMNTMFIVFIHYTQPKI